MEDIVYSFPVGGEHTTTCTPISYLCVVQFNNKVQWNPLMAKLYTSPYNTVNTPTQLYTNSYLNTSSQVRPRWKWQCTCSFNPMIYTPHSLYSYLCVVQFSIAVFITADVDAWIMTLQSAKKARTWQERVESSGYYTCNRLAINVSYLAAKHYSRYCSSHAENCMHAKWTSQNPMQVEQSILGIQLVPFIITDIQRHLLAVLAGWINSNSMHTCSLGYS